MSPRVTILITEGIKLFLIDSSYSGFAKKDVIEVLFKVESAFHYSTWEYEFVFFRFFVPCGHHDT